MSADPAGARDLAGWLRHLEAAHPRAIDLGLERVAVVHDRLGQPRPAPLCILVGGTNGKGSTVAMLVACLRAAGLRVGSYTSPHLLRYNERIAIDGREAADAAILAAFERIEAARQDVSLTYFEFGTLAAFLLLAEAGLDAAVLEIGLGGRLDAVNLIDGDAAVLTSVDLDHTEYLGSTREHIAAEKAHIFRPGRPAVIGADDPPVVLLDHVRRIGAIDLMVGRELQYAELGDGSWLCTLPDGSRHRLPWPAQLPAPCQLRNAAAAVLVLWSLRARWPFSMAAITEGLKAASLPGRLQRLAGGERIWVDVGHNPEAARVLARWLSAQAGPRVAVFGVLGDKDIAGIVEALVTAFDAWILLDLRPLSPRAADPEQVATLLSTRLPAGVPVATATAIDDALRLGRAQAAADGLVLVFGSFLTVAAALQVEQEGT